MNRRIAIITTGFTGSTLPLAKGFINKGIEVDYYILRGKIHDMEAIQCEYNSPHLGINAVPPEKWKELRVYYNSDLFNLYCINLPRSFRRVPLLSRIMALFRRYCIRRAVLDINKKNYDLVNVVARYDTNEIVLYLKSLTCKHKVMSLHEVAPNKVFSDSLRLTPLMEYLFANKINIIVHSNNSLKEILKYNEVDKSLVKRIPFGLFETYKMVNDTPIEGVPDKFILFFGGIFPYKGLSVLYDSVVKHREYFKDVKIVIAGEGKDPVLDRIVGDPQFVCFNRRLSSQELVWLIGKSMFIVCPHLAISQSGIPQTAFVYEKPLIASNLLAFREVITDGEDGLLFRAGDDEDLARKEHALLSDDTLYSSLIGHIKEFEVRKPVFSWNSIAEEYMSFL